MKKILMAAALVFSVVTGQFAQAQTYTPQKGDKAIIKHRGCHWCYMSYNETDIYRQKQIIFKDEVPVYGCNSSPHGDGKHGWANTFTVSYYLFTGGKWQQVTDY